MIRGIVISVLEGVIKRFSANGRSDETISDREYFQHYGYTSRPKPGAEIIIIREGGHFVAVASDDRRYRIALEEGECSLYDDLGQKVHLTRDGIQVSSPLKITATAPEVDIVASSQVTITTPLVQISDNVTIGGNLDVTGEVTGQASITAAANVADAAGSKTMAGMRETFDLHTHVEHGDGGGITDPPAEGM